MTETPAVPPRPIGRWERARAAAQRAGFPSTDLFMFEVAAGRVQVRTLRAGKRGLVFVASNDVDALAALAAAGALA